MQSPQQQPPASHDRFRAGTADDVRAAEDAAADLASALRRAVAAVETTDDIGDGYGAALDGAMEALSQWERYCRPSCRFRERGVCD